jgi:hypothetical protein
LLRRRIGCQRAFGTLRLNGLMVAGSFSQLALLKLTLLSLAIANLAILKLTLLKLALLDLALLNLALAQAALRFDLLSSLGGCLAA